MLVIQDPEMMKEIFLKEYPKFSSHGLYYDMKDDPLSGHLFNLAGADWKFVRTKLTPTFTSAKIKNMFSVIQECVGSLHKAVDRQRLMNNELVDVRDLLACLGTDIIASVAFGVESDSLGQTQTMFRKMGRNMMAPSLRKLIQFTMRGNFTLARILKPKATDPQTHKFFMETFAKTVDYREKNNITRNDFLDLMIRLKNEDQSRPDSGEFNGRKISRNDIVAQSYVFFLAGFETSSSTSGFALLELAKHPDIQRKVQEECDRAMQECDGKVTYDTIQKLEYTDMVLHETMRLYPSLTRLQRATIQACRLPLTDVQLDKDTIIWIPLLALHTDERYFSDPYKFDPERFTEENKKNIPPFVYMPFGEGPRHCIGMRFGMVQMKSVLLELMCKYNVEVPENVNANVEFHPYTFLSTPKESFYLKMTPRHVTVD